jgi:hypothetical protein
MNKFYAVAVEEFGAYTIVKRDDETPMIASTKEGARRLKAACDTPEGLVILKCEVVE